MLLFTVQMQGFQLIGFQYVVNIMYHATFSMLDIGWLNNINSNDSAMFTTYQFFHILMFWHFEAQ